MVWKTSPIQVIATISINFQLTFCLIQKNPFSTEIFSIEVNLHWSHAIWTEIKRRYIFRHGKIDTALCSATILHLHLFHIFHHRFGGGRFLFAKTNLVVSWAMEINLRNLINWSNSNVWLQSVRKRFPFDWKTPCGYLAAITMQYAIIVYGLQVGACAASLAFGCYFYVMAATKCLKQNLSAIKQSAKRKSDRKFIREQLVEFVEFHSHTKQLSIKLRFFFHCQTCWQIIAINSFRSFVGN